MMLEINEHKSLKDFIRSCVRYYIRNNNYNPSYIIMNYNTFKRFVAESKNESKYWLVNDDKFIFEGLIITVIQELDNKDEIFIDVR